MSVEVKNLSKQFNGHQALQNISLKVGSGGLTALLGPSGSGKTTLLRIIAGLETADAGSGSIYFHGQDVTSNPVGERGVGFVFQHYALFRHMTVQDNIAFGLNIRPRQLRPSKKEISDRVGHLLKLVQLEGLGKRLPSQLSGGQRQRVALARALAIEPKVLLLDEPFGALDAKVRKDLRRWLRRFHEEVQLTTIFVTHDQEEALEMADEVVVMNKARIEQIGTPQEVYDHPASPFVYEFLGNVNRLDASVGGFAEAESFETRHGRHLYVRPHDVEVLPATDDREGAAAVVRDIHAAGPVARLACQLKDRPGTDLIDAEISREQLRQLGLEPGHGVLLRLRRSHRFQEDFSI